eukprot:120433_1
MGSIYPVIIMLSIISVFSERYQKETEEFTRSYNNNVFNINGFAPINTDNGPFPLFIYLIGTAANSVAWGPKAQIYVNYMATNGFISASLWYNNQFYPSSCDGNNGFKSKAELMFNTSNSQSAISVLCSDNQLNIDCNLGIVLFGISQGANLISLSQLYSTQYTISGIMEMGGGDMGRHTCLQWNNLELPTNKIRSRVGENDNVFCGNCNCMVGCRIEQESITGVSCPLSPAHCVQPDGSGWYIIQRDETGSGIAGHCYAYLGSSCNTDYFDNVYYQGCGLDCDWTFESDLEWLITRVYTV